MVWFHCFQQEMKYTRTSQHCTSIKTTTLMLLEHSVMIVHCKSTITWLKSEGRVLPSRDSLVLEAETQRNAFSSTKVRIPKVCPPPQSRRMSRLFVPTNKLSLKCTKNLFCCMELYTFSFGKPNFIVLPIPKTKAFSDYKSTITSTFTWKRFNQWLSEIHVIL